MKRAILLTVLIGICAGAAWWMFAQTAPQPLASIFPAGPALYLEARDFGAMLADWNSSAEKSTWLQSANHEAFSRSWLSQKLGKAQEEFEAAAGVPPDYAMLSSVAGGNSALAIYDIGNLEFLYITHVASARAMDTALWKARGSYQTRHAGNTDFYLKEDKATHRIAAFAYSGDTLILATREDLIAGALQLMARTNLPAVASEKWFLDATQAAALGQNGGQGDLRLVYNMQALARTFHFRSHWIQRNVADLREYSSGLSDLRRTRGDFTEQRVLLRMTPSNAIGDESATGQLLAAVPDDAGFYRVWLHASSPRAAYWIEEKLFDAGDSLKRESKSAPRVEETAEAGSTEDLETRIDEPPLTENRDAFRAMETLLASANIDAMLEVASTVVDRDQVFVKPQSAIALFANAPWDANAVRSAMANTAAMVWSGAASAPNWTNGANGVAEIEGLGKLAIAIDGRWLVIGNSADVVNAVFARRNRTAVAGAAYAAGWRHSRELPNFERMFKLIDFPQLQPAAQNPDAENEGVEPQFFSSNLASLGRTLKRVETATITVHDAGSMLRESAVYHLIP